MNKKQIRVASGGVLIAVAASAAAMVLATGYGYFQPRSSTVQSAVQVLLTKQWSDVGPGDPRKRAEMTPGQAAIIDGIRSTIHMTDWKVEDATHLADGTWSIGVRYATEYTAAGSPLHFDSTATAIVRNDGFFKWSGVRLDRVHPVDSHPGAGHRQ